MPSLPTCSRPLPALLLTLALVACGGGADPRPSGERPLVVEPDSPSVASGIADPTAPRIVSIVVTGNDTTGDTGVVRLKRNVPVRLVVISDRADTVVVQGLGLRALATAEVPVQLDFLASRAGEFPVVLDDSGLELARLRVA